MLGLPRLLSFLLFIALCVSLAGWLMPLFSPVPRALVAPPTNTFNSPKLSAASSLLGGQAGLGLPNQYQLTGIVYAQNVRDRVAILSAAGQATMSLKVADKLASDISLSEIHADYVVLNDHGTAKRIPLASDNKTAALKP